MQQAAATKASEKHHYSKISLMLHPSSFQSLNKAITKPRKTGKKDNNESGKGVRIFLPLFLISVTWVCAKNSLRSFMRKRKQNL